MTTLTERVVALETQVASLEAALAQAPARTADPFPVRNANARWLNQVKYAPKPDGKCATARCSTDIPAGSRAWYVPKGNPNAGLYCASCADAMGAPA